MRTAIQEIENPPSPEALIEAVAGEPGRVLLRSALFDSPQARYSFVAARPFLVFRAFGSRCEMTALGFTRRQFGNPWRVLEGLMARFELLEEIDLPFPLGGCFGYWGYELKHFVEPRLTRRAVNDLELPDCHAGFYDSLVVFDHRLDRAWIISTGFEPDGSRSEARAQSQVEFWQEWLRFAGKASELPDGGCVGLGDQSQRLPRLCGSRPFPEDSKCDPLRLAPPPPHTAAAQWLRLHVHSNFSRAGFIDIVRRAQRYIRAGDIYQVNLAQRLSAPAAGSGWDFCRSLTGVSPAPFSAWIDADDFQLCSSSPELFLRMSGAHVQTRPIKGTRPRSADPTRDAQLSYELQTSPKEMAELVMITDLLRNDLGKICEFGSVSVPELVRLERFAQVQHLVSTVTGRLRPEVPHFAALASCFPGGSVTGAPKIRAMDIIDELEPVTRGPYTGALGYLGFNRESQLSIVIRTAICRGGAVHFYTGAGIVADSVPEAEYEETLAKAGGFLAALAARGRAAESIDRKIHS